MLVKGATSLYLRLNHHIDVSLQLKYHMIDNLDYFSMPHHSASAMKQPQIAMQCHMLSVMDRLQIVVHLNHDRPIHTVITSNLAGLEQNNKIRGAA